MLIPNHQIFTTIFVSLDQTPDKKGPPDVEIVPLLIRKSHVEVPTDDEDRLLYVNPKRQGARRQQKYKKVKSLGNFCQQFIALFAGYKDVISLEEAARLISEGNSIEDKILKTKIRRLYDIANVLQSIGLIEKTHCSNNRKPAFRWIGLQGVKVAIEEIKEIVRNQGLKLTKS